MRLTNAYSNCLKFGNVKILRRDDAGEMDETECPDREIWGFIITKSFGSVARRMARGVRRVFEETRHVFPVLESKLVSPSSTNTLPVCTTSFNIIRRGFSGKVTRVRRKFRDRSVLCSTEQA